MATSGSSTGAASLPVVLANPRQVRDSAEATGRLAKTEALDGRVVGRVLAQFAEAARPALSPLEDADAQNLNESTTRRNQLMSMLVGEKNRLGRGARAVRPRGQLRDRGPRQLAGKGSSKTWTKISVGHCFAIQCGGRRTVCSARFPVWVSRSQRPSWHICQWAHWTGSR